MGVTFVSVVSGIPRIEFSSLSGFGSPPLSVNGPKDPMAHA